MSSVDIMNSTIFRFFVAVGICFLIFDQMDTALCQDNTHCLVSWEEEYSYLLPTVSDKANLIESFFEYYPECKCKLPKVIKKYKEVTQDSTALDEECGIADIPILDDEIKSLMNKCFEGTDNTRYFCAEFRKIDWTGVKNPHILRQLSKNYENIIGNYKNEFMFAEGVQFAEKIKKKFRRDFNKRAKKDINKFQRWSAAYNDYEEYKKNGDKYRKKQSWDDASISYRKAKDALLVLEQANWGKVEKLKGELAKITSEIQYDTIIKTAERFYDQAVKGNVEFWEDCANEFEKLKKIKIKNYAYPAGSFRKEELCQKKAEFYRKYQGEEIGKEPNYWFSDFKHQYPINDKRWKRERYLLGLRRAFVESNDFLHTNDERKYRNAFDRLKNEDGRCSKADLPKYRDFKENDFEAVKEKIRKLCPELEALKYEEEGDCLPYDQFNSSGKYLYTYLTKRIELYTISARTFDENKIGKNTGKTKKGIIENIKNWIDQYSDIASLEDVPPTETFDSEFNESIVEPLSALQRLGLHKCDNHQFREYVYREVSKIKKDLGQIAFEGGNLQLAASYGNTSAEIIDKSAGALELFEKRSYLQAFDQFKKVLKRIDVNDDMVLDPKYWGEDFIEQLPENDDIRAKVLLSARLSNLASKAYKDGTEIFTLQKEIDSGRYLNKSKHPWSSVEESREVILSHVEDGNADFYWLEAIREDRFTDKEYFNFLKAYIDLKNAKDKFKFTIFSDKDNERLGSKIKILTARLQAIGEEEEHQELWKRIKKSKLGKYFNSEERKSIDTLLSDLGNSNQNVDKRKTSDDGKNNFKKPYATDDDLKISSPTIPLTDGSQPLNSTAEEKTRISESDYEEIKPNNKSIKVKRFEPSRLKNNGRKGLYEAFGEYYLGLRLFEQASEWYAIAAKHGKIVEEDNKKCAEQAIKILENNKNCVLGDIRSIQDELNVVCRKYETSIHYLWGSCRENEKSYCRSLFDDNYYQYFLSRKYEKNYFIDFLMETVLEMSDLETDNILYCQESCDGSKGETICEKILSANNYANRSLLSQYKRLFDLMGNSGRDSDGLLQDLKKVDSFLEQFPETPLTIVLAHLVKLIEINQNDKDVKVTFQEWGKKNICSAPNANSIPDNIFDNFCYK